MFKKRNQALFGDGIEPDCGYCVHGPGPAENCAFRRRKKGGGACRAFRYDPLRRTPAVPPPLKKHDPGEFEL